VNDLAVLGFFKYAGFVAENINLLLSSLRVSCVIPTPSFLLPAGLSFFLLQSIGYSIDVYRGTTKREKSFLAYAAFVSFFPRLLAGPIERANHLLPQLHGDGRVTLRDFTDGLSIFVVGYFKKVALADYLALYVAQVYGAPEQYQAPALLLATFLFAWQIYFDFSGYTDMARGIARMMGIHLMLNFNNPYLAVSMGDFWKRWHISLSSWFRDYVYIPLGGSKHGPWKQARNVMITFLLSGLWHGANWNYVIWGAYHGFLLVFTRVAAVLIPVPARLRRWLVPAQIAGMFVLTNIGWLLFRETEFAALVRDFRLSPFQSSVLGRQTGAYLFFLAALYSIPLWIQSVWAEVGGRDLVSAMITDEGRPDFRVATAQALLAGLLFAGVLVLQSVTSLDFIYFQF
jgi:D-alanyl-lipoteichoic acid acyltransferase DltB (MBOAT superfamily)